MKLVIKKAASLIITLFIVSLLAFLAFQMIPGDPTTKILGTNASAQKVAELRTRLGLDRPVLLRYWDWLVSFLKGDLGTSYTYLRPVGSLLADKLPVTVLLTVVSFALTVVVSIPLGIVAGRLSRKQDIVAGRQKRKKSFVKESFLRTLGDHVAVVTGQVIMAVPPFFFGIIACYVFGIVLKWFLPGSYVSLSDSVPGCMAYLFLPAVSLALPRIAMTIRMLRGSIREELTRNYVLTARARGMSPRQIMGRHILRNAMIPVVTFLAVNAAEIMTGTIIIEQVFTIPGIGRLLVSSIGNRDFPVVQAIVVLLAAWIVIVNYIADMLIHWIDPRLRADM